MSSETKQKSKKIFSIISGILSQSINGSIFFYQTYSLYRHSQIKTNNNSITFNSYLFILPVCFFLTIALKFLGIILYHKIGARIATSIGYFAILISTFLFWPTKSIVGDYFFLAFYSIAAGITFMPPILNIFKYYPQDSDKLSTLLGISFTGIILSSLFPLYFQFFINFSFAKPSVLIGEEHIYDDKIQKNTSLSLLFYLGGIGVLSLISIGLMFSPNDNPENLLKNDEEDSEEKREKEEEIEKGMPIALIKKKLPNNDSLASTGQTRTLEVLTSCTIYQYFIYIVLISLYPISVLMTINHFGKEREIEDSYLSFSTFGILLIWGISSPIWGVLYKKLSIKTLVYIICGIQLALGSGFYYSAEIQWLYVVITSLSGLGLGFVQVVFPIYLQKIFGYDNGLFAYSYASISIGLCGLLTAGGFALVKYRFIHTIYYIYIYTTGAFFNFICGVIFFFRKEKVFEYEQ